MDLKYDLSSGSLAALRQVVRDSLLLQTFKPIAPETSGAAHRTFHWILISRILSYGGFDSIAVTAGIFVLRQGARQALTDDLT